MASDYRLEVVAPIGWLALCGLPGVVRAVAEALSRVVVHRRQTEHERVLVRAALAHGRTISIRGPSRFTIGKPVAAGGRSRAKKRPKPAREPTVVARTPIS